MTIFAQNMLLLIKRLPLSFYGRALKECFALKEQI